MRSHQEIAFRLRQEARNLAMLAHPPVLETGIAVQGGLPHLPDPERVIEALKGSDFSASVIELAEMIRAHRFPIFGGVLETGPEIRWRRDYARKIEWAADYFRLIPYLDAGRVGDHKTIWELNRHQHLVVLAQAYRFTGNAEFVTEIAAQLESWLEQNPFLRGMNWGSALEVAFRALSWTWVLHLAGDQLPPALLTQLGTALYRHGLFIENNLSVYFSPNTHLLGEAVALHALGTLFPQFPRARRWRDAGAHIVNTELERQVRRDGAHFEQSTYYHVYALDMFLFHGILAGAGDTYREKIALMADYLAAVQGPSRILPFIGDDDGGRFFHPFGARNQFGRATLATCGAWLDRAAWPCAREDFLLQAAWWLGCVGSDATVKLDSHLFPEIGMASMTADGNHVLIDAGPFGPWGSGHSHSDSLSIVARSGDREILIDPGAYTYVGDSAARNWFRGSAAHNTVRIDGRDQATPVNPFRWKDQPAVAIREWQTSEKEDFLDAECVSAGITHRRWVRFVKPDLLLIVDEILGSPDEHAGEHMVEQFWHLGSPEDRDRIVVEGDSQLIKCWRSEVFGSREPAFALHVGRKSVLPVTLASAVYLGAGPCNVSIERGAAGIQFHLGAEIRRVR